MAAPDTRSAPVVRGPALLFCPGDRPDRFARRTPSPRTPRTRPATPWSAPSPTPAPPRSTPPASWSASTPPGTPWHAADVAALAAFPAVAIMLPMAERPEDVEGLAPHPVVALCETARGVLEAPRIAAASTCIGLMWGSEDLLADLGGRTGRAPGGYRPAIEEARTRILYAARAAGVTPVDTVLVDIDDLDLLAADSADAVAVGHAAKACIHPKQVAVVRAAFRPGDAEVARARDVLEASAGQPGVFRFRGCMVDAPVLAHAREVLRQAAG